MAFAPGTRLGFYEVTAKIGEGGMGEVYQTRDTTLDRNVALKVLPDEQLRGRAGYVRAAGPGWNYAIHQS